MPETAESAADREKRLRREQAMRQRRPVVYGMDEAPPGAREVSREEFERIRAGRRPVVDLDIGEAEMLPSPEAEAVGGMMSGTRQAPPTPSRAEPARAYLERMGVPQARRPQPRLDLAAPATAEADRMRSEQERAQQDREYRARTAQEDADAYERNLDAAYDRSFLEGLQADNRVNAMGEGVVQGLTLGFGDELGAAGRVLAGTADDYESERDRLRANLALAQQEAPRAYAGAEMLGSALPALAIPGGAGRTALGRVASAGGVGMGFGIASGFGHAQGTAREQRNQAIEGGALGLGLGVGGQLLGEVGAAGLNTVRPREPGAPAPGRDFTPEQQTRIDADEAPGGMFDMSRERAALERRAANRRVLEAMPGATEADLARIDAEYPGGIRGMARDLDESGISPRRSVTREGTRVRRAELATRQPPAVVAGMDDVAPEPQMPPGARAGQFADDEGWSGPVRTVESPAPSATRWTDDLPEDPASRVPLDPADTLERQMEREFAREGRRTGASTQEATPRPSRRGRIREDATMPVDLGDMEDITPPEPRSPDPEAARNFHAQRGYEARFGGGQRPQQRPTQQSGLMPGETPGGVPPIDDLDEPIDFGDGMGPPSARTTEPTPQQAARQRQNIVAAERNASRGATSRSTQDERTWPVRMEDTVDITPPGEPPPLPRRPPPLPRRPAPQRDLGAWEAPPVEPQAPEMTPGQRAGREVLSARDRAERAAAVTPSGSLTDRARAQAEDFVRNRIINSPAGAELRSDVLADRIVRRLQQNEGSRRWGVMLENDIQRGGRSFGLSLLALMRREPAVAQAVAEEAYAFDRDYNPLAPPPEQGEPQQNNRPRSEWDVDYGSR